MLLLQNTALRYGRVALAGLEGSEEIFVEGRRVGESTAAWWRRWEVFGDGVAFACAEPPADVGAVATVP